MPYSFSITRTRAAQASLGAMPGLRQLMMKAGRLVHRGELQQFTEFTLSIVLMSDDELLEVNRTSLAHDYYTDIITFEIERGATSLETELYISVDRARENARKAGVSLAHELQHLVIHGVLHIAGFSDKGRSAKNQMQKRERFYLAKL